MKYQKAIKILLLSFAVIILILIAIFSVKMMDLIVTAPDSVISLDDDWTIGCKGQLFHCDDISEADIGVINEFEKVIISRTLDNVGFDNPCLSFYSIHALVYVYLDEKLIYDFGMDYYLDRNTVPKKTHYISLGNDYAGKTLTIQLIGGRNASFSGLSKIYLGERDDILTLDFHKSSIPIAVGAFLFTLGIILIILSPYLFIYHSNDLRILFSGLISIMLGIYVMSYYRVFDLLLDNSLNNTVFEYASLYNIPTVIVGYLMSVYNGKTKKIFAGLFVLDIGFFLSSIAVHLSHAARFSDFTHILHVVSGIEFVISVVLIFRDYIAHRNDNVKNVFAADNIFVFGLVAFMLFSVIDIVRYNILKYGHRGGETNASLTGFTLGALIFVVCLMISYLYYSLFSSNIASMQSKIADLAYTDALTGLSNRARCEQVMQMLSSQHSTYAIISLDLNRLKQVNDTLGHHEGDRLLTGFATILSDCFWDANLVGRMGGDEFIVILMEDRTLNLTKRIHELYSIISDWNHKEQAFQYSVSYGYSYSFEVPNSSANEVYMLADNRMYEMKREHHGKEDQEVTANV